MIISGRASIIVSFVILFNQSFHRHPLLLPAPTPLMERSPSPLLIPFHILDPELFLLLQNMTIAEPPGILLVLYQNVSISDTMLKKTPYKIPLGYYNNFIYIKKISYHLVRAGKFSSIE